MMLGRRESSALRRQRARPGRWLRRSVRRWLAIALELTQGLRSLLRFGMSGEMSDPLEHISTMTTPTQVMHLD